MLYVIYRIPTTALTERDTGNKIDVDDKVTGGRGKGCNLCQHSALIHLHRFA